MSDASEGRLREAASAQLDEQGLLGDNGSIVGCAIYYDPLGESDLADNFTLLRLKPTASTARIQEKVSKNLKAVYDELHETDVTLMWNGRPLVLAGKTMKDILPASNDFLLLKAERGRPPSVSVAPSSRQTSRAPSAAPQNGQRSSATPAPRISSSTSTSTPASIHGPRDSLTPAPSTDGQFAVSVKLEPASQVSNGALYDAPVKPEPASQSSNTPLREAQSAVTVKPEPDANVKEEEGLGANGVDINSDERPLPPKVQLQQLADDSVETMESLIKVGVDLLDMMKPVLRSVPECDDAELWLKQLDDIRKQSEYTRSVIGVVGNTGAGKSSVINALLEEERLLPTNCMRACTAVVTEMSYNNETDDKYLAKIEFISKEDWMKELRCLFQDLLTDGGNIARISNPDSEAGVAWAKIKGVYGASHSREDIQKSNADDLCNYGTVRAVLGTTKVIKETDSLRFYKQLQKYVDSQEKSGGKDDRQTTMEYWPIIKRVQIMVKSEVLKTGAVLVDLPGVADSNAARASVADKYMQQVTGLWVVAPIGRAVDDKAAANLMGEGFKRQLLIDGGYNSISFICSKSDDISVSEAIMSLHLEDELAEQMEELDDLEQAKEAKDARLKALLQYKKDTAKAFDEIDDCLTAWEELKDKAEGGETVYEPKKKDDEKDDSENSKKRKRGQDRGRKSAKKAKRSYAEDDDDDDFVVDDDEAEIISDDEEGSPQSDVEDEPQKEDEPREPLTIQAIDDKIEQLRQDKKDGRKAKQRVAADLGDVREDIAALKVKMQKAENVLATYCIKARNKYSTGAIQADFAMGLEDLDRQQAEELDDFDPSAPVRDYDQIGKSLPVFCVSSRGYQKVCGRLRKDGAKTVFPDKESTGMPALKRHCMKLTDKARLATGRRFLTNLSQFTNSLRLWCSSDASAGMLTETDKAREARILDKRFKQLDSNLDKVIESAVKNMKDELRMSIFDRYEDAIQIAGDAAPTTSEKWGLKVNREEYDKGGWYWATYKAVVRRDGNFVNARGPHLMNDQLAEPLIKHLVTNWEKAFTRRFPAILKDYARLSNGALTTFHRQVEEQANKLHVGVAQLHLLAGQLTTYGDLFTGLADSAVELVTATQREVNREFTPAITEAMRPVYQRTHAESGPGQFIRMKGMMRQHVADNKYEMFEDACEAVETRLKGMVHEVEEKMDTTTAGIYETMQRDYGSIFGVEGAPKEYSGKKGRQEKVLKEKVEKALVGMEKPFERVVNPEPARAASPANDNEMDIEVNAHLALSNDAPAEHVPAFQDVGNGNTTSNIEPPSDSQDAKAPSELSELGTKGSKAVVEDKENMRLEEVEMQS